MAPTSNAATACAVCAVQKMTSGPSAGKQLQRLDARQLRHLDVEQDHVDAARAHALQHLVRVARTRRRPRRRASPPAAAPAACARSPRRRRPARAAARRRARRSRRRSRRCARHRQASPRPACVSPTAAIVKHRLTIIGERQPALDDFDAAAARRAGPRYAPGFSIDTTSRSSAVARAVSTISPAWPAAGPVLDGVLGQRQQQHRRDGDVGQRRRAAGA